MIAVDEDGISKVLIDGYCGKLVSPVSVKVFVGTCVDLVNDPVLATTWEQAGREIVERNYQMSHSVEQLIGIFIKAAGLS